MGQNFRGWLQTLKFPDKYFADAGLQCRTRTQLCLIRGIFFVDVRPTVKSVKFCPTKISCYTISMHNTHTYTRKNGGHRVFRE